MNKSKDYGMKAVKLAGKGQKVFVPAVFVIHLGKTITQATVIQIAVDNLPDIRSGKIHTASRTASHRPEQRFQNGTLHARSTADKSENPPFIFTHQVLPLMHRY
jgi:hypothetical protein